MRIESRVFASSLGIGGLLAVPLALSAAGLATQPMPNQRAQDSKTPQLVGPKRTVQIPRVEIKLTHGNAPSGFSFGGGFNNNSVQGSAADGTIDVSNPQDFGDGLSELLVTSLTESRAFTVIENDPPAPSPEEQLRPTGTGPERPTSQYILKAVITELSCHQRSGGLSIGAISGGQGQYQNKVVMDVRLVEPGTQAVLETVRATGIKTSKSSIFGASQYTGGSMWIPATKILDLTFQDFSQSPLAEACRNAAKSAANDLVKKLSKRTWESNVLRFDSTGNGFDLYLDASGDCGLRVGDRLDFCKQGDPLTDRRTGVIVGRTRPTKLGQLEVAITSEERLICRPVPEFADQLKALAAAAEDPNGPVYIVRLPEPSR